MVRCYGVAEMYLLLSGVVMLSILCGQNVFQFVCDQQMVENIVVFVVLCGCDVVVLSLPSYVYVPICLSRCAVCFQRCCAVFELYCNKFEFRYAPIVLEVFCRLLACFQFFLAVLLLFFVFDFFLFVLFCFACFVCLFVVIIFFFLPQTYWAPSTQEKFQSAGFILKTATPEVIETQQSLVSWICVLRKPAQRNDIVIMM